MIKLPSNLEVNEEQLHKRMINMAPQGIDVSEGGLYYDHTRPTASVVSEVVNFNLRNIVAIAFVQYAYGEYLEYHGEPIGLYRRKSTRSTGYVTVEGKPNLVVGRATKFSTIGEEVIEFESIMEVKLDSSGKGVIPIQSVLFGKDNNIADNTIIYTDYRGITSVTNEEPTINGVDNEDDETYRERIMIHNQNKPLSGAKQDYVRWSKEIDGVGEVIVLPLWNGEGTVKILITDSNGDFANEPLIEELQNHLDPKPGMGEGKSPIGAHVTVASITQVDIKISVTIDGTINEFEIKELLNKYLMSQSTVKYHEIGAVLINHHKVNDYKDLKINDDIINISLEVGERAVVSEVIING